MPLPRAKGSIRSVRWLGPAALLALTPKCGLCLLAYAGLGGLAGLTGPEMCGASRGFSAAPGLALAWIALTTGLALWALRRVRQ